MAGEAQSIVELAECVKELCRLLKNVVPEGYPRLEAVYKKASLAKNRVYEQTLRRVPNG
jgi:hypothetical protein